MGLDAKHKGTERYADEFSKEFIQAYRMALWGFGK